MDRSRKPLEAQVVWFTDDHNNIQKFNLETHHFMWNNLNDSDFPLIMSLLRLLITLPIRLARILFASRELHGAMNDVSFNSMDRLCQQLAEKRNEWFRDLVFPPRGDNLRQNVTIIGKAVDFTKPQLDLYGTVNELNEHFLHLRTCIANKEYLQFFYYARQMFAKFTHCRNLAETFVRFGNKVYTHRNLNTVVMHPILIELLTALSREEKLETKFLNVLNSLSCPQH